MERTAQGLCGMKSPWRTNVQEEMEGCSQNATVHEGTDVYSSCCFWEAREILTRPLARLWYGILQNIRKTSDWTFWRRRPPHRLKKVLQTAYKGHRCRRTGHCHTNYPPQIRKEGKKENATLGLLDISSEIRLGRVDLREWWELLDSNHHEKWAVGKEGETNHRCHNQSP
jgi:hypothetical protein